jgi:predicted MFS family arabinose efflux permease
LQARAFLVVALAYVACAALLAINVSPTVARRLTNPIRDLRDVIALPSVRHLAPVWLCVNAVVGLWLGPTLIFLLTQHSTSTQYLAGIYAAEPARVGWLLLSYAAVFSAGVLIWSFILPHMRVARAMKVAVSAMLPVCGTLFLLNHSAHQSAATRWSLGAITAGLILIESGFTPAALAWLAQAVPIQSGRGAAMGIYSVLLTLVAIAGSLSAAVLGERYSVDCLLFGTAAIAVLALLFLNHVPGGDRRNAERRA